ncbi:MAG TPA: thioesterase family protein [Synergistaceae bacterium]|nr:thioesterase family protein [Synergistaceae bacterium]HPJ24890.1 thioesterase family protein [Synergistaceae bacterium]HPQ36985.1 thioesterase family protein [Synergistaceae bacterium]
MTKEMPRVLKPDEWEISLRVRYSETDKMGIVYHANYLPWFEMGRTEFCRQLGVAYSDWEKQGVFLPCVEAHCRYKRPARYDDLLVVRTVIRELKRCSVTFGYKIFREEVLLTEGYTKHAFTNPQGELLSKPEPFYGMLERRMSFSK